MTVALNSSPDPVIMGRKLAKASAFSWQTSATLFAIACLSKLITRNISSMLSAGIEIPRCSTAMAVSRLLTSAAK